jgi:hypothetical protein
MSTDTFRATLGDQGYTDPGLFALDLKAAGLSRTLPSAKLDRGKTPAQLTVLTTAEHAWLGTWVWLKDGRTGQVWSLADLPNYVHVVLDGQQAVKVHRDDLTQTADRAGQPVLA